MLIRILFSCLIFNFSPPGLGWGDDPNGQVFQGIGQVLVPEGHPGDDHHHQNRSASEMAGKQNFLTTENLK